MASNGWAAESTHFYYPDGTPCNTIVGKNGKERPPDIRDARRLSLVPGVTRILRCAHSFGLERWKAEQLLLAGLTLPRIDGESEAAWIARVWEDSAEQGRKAAEQGVLIHAAVESHYRGEPVDHVFYPWIAAVTATVEFTFDSPVWCAEKSVACPEHGYGGKVDLHAPGLVLDIKTKDGALDDAKLWDEHFMQLAAYAQALQLDAPRAGIVFVSRTEPKCVVKEIDADDLARGWTMFRSLLAYWRAQNRMEGGTQ